MRFSTGIVLVALVFLGGFVVGDLTDVMTSSATAAAVMQMDHSGMNMNATPHNHSAHKHKMLEVNFSSPPHVDIEVIEDPKAGWNVHIKTENFTFAPERASTEHIEGEGHGHIYVDGVKLNRIYGNWYHIGTLEPGQREIMVTLNANSHEDLALIGEVVSDSKIITVE